MLAFLFAAWPLLFGLEMYKKMGKADVLITTSEQNENSDVKAIVGKIIEDIENSTLTQTEGAYSYHQYYI
jgi:hypothetical protein